MRLDPKHAHELLPRVDPGRVRSGRAVGLRDGALLALVAAGLSAIEIAALQASAITWSTPSSSSQSIATASPGPPLWPTDLGARLLAWLTESRLWAVPEPVFRGQRGPLTPVGICAVLKRYHNRRPAPARRKRFLPGRK